MQDMQYVITDGTTFVDLERDATNHVVTMPDEKALQYTVTNTAKSGKYRITTDYATDPARATLVTNTRFQSLDGGTYRLYLLANPSMAGGGANDNAWWDGTGLVASEEPRHCSAARRQRSSKPCASRPVSPHTTTATRARPATASSTYAPTKP